MLRYFEPSNWFFVIMVVAICSYWAINQNTQKINKAPQQAVMASFIRNIIR